MAAFACENNGTADNSRAKPSAVKAIRRILLLQSEVLARNYRAGQISCQSRTGGPLKRRVPHPNPVIPTEADHREAMTCAVEGPAVSSHTRRTIRRELEYPLPRCHPERAREADVRGTVRPPCTATTTDRTSTPPATAIIPNHRTTPPPLRRDTENHRRGCPVQAPLGRGFLSPVIPTEAGATRRRSGGTCFCRIDNKFEKARVFGRQAKLGRDTHRSSGRNWGATSRAAVWHTLRAMTSDSAAVWIGVAQVVPRDGCELLPPHKGTFVNFLTLATNESEYRAKVAGALTYYRLDLIEIQDARPFTRADEPSQEILAIAAELEQTKNPQHVRFATLHTFPRVM